MYLLKHDSIYFFIYDAEYAIYKFRPTNFSLHIFDIIKTMHFYYLQRRTILLSPQCGDTTSCIRQATFLNVKGKHT
jgi:hypothetical protein